MNEIILHEVGMRDGLQVEKQIVPTQTKILWIESLLESGVDIIQLGSFVHPEKMPQLADTDELFRHFSEPGRRRRHTILSGLVLNEKGLDRGLACGVDQFCMGVSASDTHSRKNTGMSTPEALHRILAIAKRALEAGKLVQVSVQSAFGCGFEGPVPEDRVLSLVKQFLEADLRTISLADTAGHANPWQVEQLYSKIFDLDPGIECACHFHDTYGLGMVNSFAAIQAGVKYFESAFGGLGGCPFTAVAGGNVCTEDFVHLLHRHGWREEVQLQPFIELARTASTFFGRTLPGIVHRSGPIPAAQLQEPVETR
ncbi:MAG: hydroxymethylglutaryl-CoA lyase [Acidobacteriia bacterium]|nr:hydroxymethylglutaryl-CoA lyase [Terriglobia bacterium]